MKFLTVVVFSLAVACGSSSPAANGRVKDLVDAALAYARSQAKEDPATFPEIRFMDNWISNVTLAGGSKLVIDHEVIDEKFLGASFRATTPELTLDLDYNVDSMAFGRPITGKGHFKLVVTNITYVIHGIELEENDHHGFEVANLDGDFYIDDISVEMGDLKINGETASDVGTLIETLYHFFYHLERKDASQSMCDQIRHQLNDLLYGRSIEEATQWLKNHTK